MKQESTSTVAAVSRALAASLAEVESLACTTIERAKAEMADFEAPSSDTVDELGRSRGSQVAPYTSSTSGGGPYTSESACQAGPNGASRPQSLRVAVAQALEAGGAVAADAEAKVEAGAVAALAGTAGGAPDAAANATGVAAVEEESLAAVENEAAVAEESAAAAEEKAIMQVFTRFDQDGSGEIDASELGAAAAQLGLAMSEEDLKTAMAEMDKDGSGEVDLEEFSKWYRAVVREPGEAEAATAAEEAAAAERSAEVAEAAAAREAEQLAATARAAEDLAAALDSLKAGYAQRQGDLEAQLGATLSALEAEHADAEARQVARLSNMEAHHSHDVSQANERHAAALRAVEARHASEVLQERQAALDRHADVLSELEARHAEARSAAEERQSEELRGTAERHAAACSAMRARHSAELRGLQERQHAEANRIIEAAAAADLVAEARSEADAAIAASAEARVAEAEARACVEGRLMAATAELRDQSEQIEATPLLPPSYAAQHELFMRDPLPASPLQVLRQALKAAAAREEEASRGSSDKEQAWSRELGRVRWSRPTRRDAVSWRVRGRSASIFRRARRPPTWRGSRSSYWRAGGRRSRDRRQGCAAAPLPLATASPRGVMCAADARPPLAIGRRAHERAPGRAD